MQRALILFCVMGFVAAAAAQTVPETPSQTPSMADTAEPHDMYLPHDTTISRAGINYVTVGYASDSDSANSRHPSSPTIRIVSGGIIEHDLFAYNHSRVVIAAGHIQGTLSLRNRSQATVSAGSFVDGGEGGGSLDLLDSSTIDVEGGHFSNTFQAGASSTLSIRGGLMKPSFGPPKITLFGNATLNLFGMGLTKTRSALTDQSGGIVYKLSGRLSDGTDIHGYELVIAGGHPRINLLAPGAALPVPHGAGRGSAVFFPKNAVISSAIPSSVVVGFANANDRDSSTHPTSPTVRLTPGSSVGRDLTVYNDSHVRITGGHVVHSVTVRGGSTLTFSRGRVGYALSALDNSHVSVTGGSVGEILDVGSGGTLNISGGQFGSTAYADGGTLKISGGKLGSTLQANSGTLELFGRSLRKTSVVDPSDGTSFRRYRLSGRLQDGTSLRGVFLVVANDRKPQVTFHEVPARHP